MSPRAHAAYWGYQTFFSMNLDTQWAQGWIDRGCIQENEPYEGKAQESDSVLRREQLRRMTTQERIDAGMSPLLSKDQLFTRYPQARTIHDMHEAMSAKTLKEIAHGRTR